MELLYDSVTMEPEKRLIELAIIRAKLKLDLYRCDQQIDQQVKRFEQKELGKSY